MVQYEASLSKKQVMKEYMKIQEQEYVQSQAALQRELDGIIQTLEYQMVMGGYLKFKTFTKQLHHNPIYLF